MTRLSLSPIHWLESFFEPAHRVHRYSKSDYRIRQWMSDSTIQELSIEYSRHLPKVNWKIFLIPHIASSSSHQLILHPASFPTILFKKPIWTNKKKMKSPAGISSSFSLFLCRFACTFDSHKVYVICINRRIECPVTSMNCSIHFIVSFFLFNPINDFIYECLRADRIIV